MKARRDGLKGGWGGRSLGLAMVAFVLASCGGGSAATSSAGSSSPSTTIGTSMEKPVAESSTTTTYLLADSEPLPSGWPAELAPPEDCSVTNPTSNQVGGTEVLGFGCIRRVGVEQSQDDFIDLARRAGFEIVSDIDYDDPPSGRFRARRGSVEFSGSVIPASEVSDSDDFVPGSSDGGSVVSLAVSLE